MMRNSFTRLLPLLALTATAGSLPLQAAPGGTVYFINKVLLSDIDAPVFDVDGVTPLTGPRYLAQLWAGLSPDDLQPVGEPVAFQTGKAAGYFWAPGGTVMIPPVPPGEMAHLEVRAWDGAVAGTFEAAWALGGPTGISPGFAVVTGGAGEPPAVPADLVGLQSFQLRWREDLPPVVRRQPESVTAKSGQWVSLEAEVTGSGELVFQWEKDGAPLPGATEPRLVFSSVEPGDAGAYRLVAMNAWGEIASEVVVLRVKALGGTVYFANIAPISGVDAPVFDVDGVTGLIGPGFVVQLWAGPEPSSLAPIGAAVPFRSGLQGDAGYWNAPVPTRVIDSVPAGETAWLQVVVWESVFGPSFDKARLAGGRFGASNVFPVKTGGGGAPPAVPADMTGLESFHLQSGIQPPVITRQPWGGAFFVGETATLSAEFAGTGPLEFQWWRDDGLLPGATEATLILPALTGSDAGSYALRVRGPFAETVSEPAVVTVLSVPAGVATLRFANRFPGIGLDAPVFFAGGELRVAGTAFVAQLWVGLDLDSLAPVGEPAPFLEGSRAGYWNAGDGLAVVLPDAAPGTPAYVQVRVWQVTQPDYSSALAAGAWVGKSEIMELPTGGTPEQPLPAPLTGLQPILLGKLPQIGRAPDGDSYVVGDNLTLRVTFQSSDPPALQWRKDGVDLPGADQVSLSFASLTEADSGDYSLVIRNRTGTVESEPIPIRVNRLPGLVRFQNSVPEAGIDAPVLLEDAWTPVEGGDYRARLYAGPAADQLAPVGVAVRFGFGMQAGYFLGGVVSLERVPAGEVAFVQVRAWEGAYPDYESAVAAEVRIGASTVLELVTGGNGAPPALLTGLESFQLEPQHPVFVQQPLSLWLVDGEAAVLTATLAGVDKARLQWQQRVSEGGWADIPNATSSSFTIPQVSLEMDGQTFRLVATDEAGPVASEPAELTVSPILPLGDQEGIFELRLMPGTGPGYVIEFSPDLVQWATLTTLEATPPTLELQENDQTRAAEATRFYRARDASTGKQASENIVGFARRLLRPGLNLAGAPFRLPDDRVPAVFAGAPEGTTVYLFNTARQEWGINAHEFGEWSLSEQRLPPMEGCFVVLSYDTAYEWTLTGDVPQGDFERELPVGWSLHSPPLPVAGYLGANFNLPLGFLDAVAFWAPMSREINVLFNLGDDWETDAPVVGVGEAFWVYRHQPTVWKTRYNYPP